MSRAPVRIGTALRRPGDEDDICPVCKSSRYLNPNMRFLVNPECYHKMCESCVDRIFSQGPAPCPVAGCARTLRKPRFRKQNFDDIQIEREVDIRRRVAQVFDRQQSEFTSLLAYNNYLEEVETLTFNLLHNVDVAATESLLASHAAQNAAAAAIARKAASAGKESASANLSAQRGDTARRKDEKTEKREPAETDPAAAAAATAAGAGEAPPKKVVLKKSTARRTAAEKAGRLAASSGGTGGGDVFHSASSDPPGYTIKGLKPMAEPKTEAPYDAFGGLVPLALQPPRYYGLQDRYEHPWLDRARADPATQAGGCDLREYCARAMVEAFAGLGCFVGEEKLHAQAQGTASEQDVAAAGAAETVGGT